MKLSASVPALKSEARRNARAQRIPLSEALNRIALREGFSTWALLARKYAEQEAAQRSAEIPKMITEFPLTGALRKEAISVARESFARALGRMEARNPRKAMAGWDAGEYVDRILSADVGPIETDYALHLVEVFLVADAANAAAAADEAE